MRSNLIGISFLVLTILISSCSNGYTGRVVEDKSEVVDKPTCTTPYFEYKLGECCLDKDSNNVCDVDEVKREEPIEPEIIEESKEEPELAENVFKLGKGESTSFNGIEVMAVDFDNAGKSYIGVDGLVREIKTTHKLEIIRGIKVIVLEINFKENYLILELETFELGPDEYLLFVGDELQLSGKTIVLRGIDDKEVALIDIKDELFKERILEGDSKIISIFNITNIDSFFRDSPNERYSILKIERVVN